MPKLPVILIGGFLLSADIAASLFLLIVGDLDLVAVLLG